MRSRVCPALAQKYAAEKDEVHYFLPFAYTHLSNIHTELSLFGEQEGLLLSDPSENRTKSEITLSQPTPTHPETHISCGGSNLPSLHFWVKSGNL